MRTLITILALSVCSFAQGILGPIVLGSGTATGGGGGGSVALVSHASGRAVDNAVTSAMDTTGANLIVCMVSAYTAGPADNFIDSKGNTWSSLTSQTVTSGNNRETIYYVVSPTVGSGHTFTNSNTGSYSGIICAAFSGIKTTSTLESQNGTSNVSYNGLSAAQFGSVTPASTGDLAIGVMTWSYAMSDVTFSVDSSYTITDCLTTSMTTEGGCMAYKIATGTSALNPGWSNSPTTTNVIAGTNAVFAKQ